MRKVPKLVATALIFILIIGSGLSVLAAQPDGVWPYLDAYNAAAASGNTADVLITGDELINFYSQFQINSDIASMSYNVYLYRYQNAVFEKKGDYDAAIDNAKKLFYFSNYLGYTDAAIAAGARVKKIDPMTEVYALSQSGNPSYYYCAKNEPKSGSYYGRVINMDSTKNIINSTELSKESVVSVYVELGQETAGQFSWFVDKYNDGKHLVHIALNFPNEARTASEIISGTDDGNIEDTLEYLAKFQSPVYLRIGAEMNLWGMDPGVYKNAYVHVARLARSKAPNVALVWSPNCIGTWGSKLSDFYPGDEYVDWVGTSLYTNSAVNAGETEYDDNSMYFGRGAFADCILSARDVADFAIEHKKPVIITEGGTGIVSKATGVNYAAKAAAQINKMYTVLNMVYPNIKAIIYFDVDPDVDAYKYAMSNSGEVSAAYNAAVLNNPTFISQAGQTAPSYVKLSDFSEIADSVNICAYSDTLYGSQMTVTYYLPGNKTVTSASLPYNCTIDAASLAAGKYKVSAIFSDNAGYSKTKTYTLTKLLNGTVSFAQGYDENAVLDVPASWAQEEVAKSIELNLVPASMQCNFASNINRLDFCKLVINLIEQKTKKSIDEILKDNNKTLDYNSFSDTADKSVLAANALGIVNGRGNNTFDCASCISREEAAKMLSNTAGILNIKASGQKTEFADRSGFSTWAVESIGFISATSDLTSGKVVMGGVGDNMFDPSGKYTYQQAFITMLRLYRAS